MRRDLRYWHLCSKDIPDGIIFKDEEDFKAGMNFMPLALQGVDATVYCFTLMNNHIHVLISGEIESVLTFFNTYCKFLRRYLQDKYGDSSIISLFTESVIPVQDGKYFRNLVIYILRNCWKAKICGPYNYQWSTANLYFNPWLRLLPSTTIGQMRVRDVEQMLHTRRRLPEHYRVAGGIVLPLSYIDYKTVEKEFGSSLDMFEAMRYWNLENEFEESVDGAERPVYSDTTLMEKMKKDFEELHVKGIEDMDVVTFRKFVHRLHLKYGASRKQVKRITGADDETIRRFY